MSKRNRRVEKTRNAVYEALSELMREKKYTSITIQEIIDRADIGRTTFYDHFPTKDDLLHSYIEGVFESFDNRLTEHAPKDHTDRLIPVAEIFTHIQENERQIKGVLMSESGELLFNKLKIYWGQRIEPYLTEHIPEGKEPKVPIKILENYITSTLVELTHFWLRSGMQYTPEQMEQFFYSLVIPSIQSVAL